MFRHMNGPGKQVLFEKPKPSQPARSSGKPISAWQQVSRGEAPHKSLFRQFREGDNTTFTSGRSPNLQWV